MTDIALPTTLTGLDREAKQKIRNWVLRLRHAFEDDIRTQVKRYGIEAGMLLAKDAPDYLTPEEKKARRIIVAAIQRDAQNERSGEDALTAYVRECAYTLLNRLVGLKCMEAREILLVEGVQNEIITTRSEYGDRSRLLWQMREEDREYRNDETRLWRNGLVRAFRAVTLDIALLFDPDSEWSQVWPTQKTLRDAVRDINGLDAACNRDGQTSVYASPDFLGWVYQFFNAEEKEELRDETGGKPRTSHELAVLNQFYTPDWIVKFLVDNTLGRVWLRMHPDTDLREYISYLVPNTGEDEPAPLKRVCDVKLLDPACGTMHMGQYAYGLLYEMYLEEREKVGSAGWPQEPSVDSPDAIPAAILANNLHGIDIDPRAIQIAALTLLLTMKEQARAHGLNPKNVRVERMNLVCADAVNLGDAEMEEFFQELALNPQVYGGIEVLRRVVKAVWEGLKHVAELGSLVQVGEEVERALEAPTNVRQHLYEPTQTSMAEALELSLLQLRLTEEQRATAREQLEDALANYTRKHLGAEDINQRLFAQETEKAVHLLDLLHEKYDVVVQNPPFGNPVGKVKTQLEQMYKNGSGNIYTYFIEALKDRLSVNGYIGSVTSCAFLVQTTFTQFREMLTRNFQPIVIAECGPEVLDDANVEVALSILGRLNTRESACFLNLRPGQTSSAKFQQWLNDPSGDSPIHFMRTIRSFSALPDSMFLYDLPQSVVDCYIRFPRLDPNIAQTAKGLNTGTNDRFYLRVWEVNGYEIGRGNKWIPLANGGEFSPFYRNYDQVVLWENNGQTIRTNVNEHGEKVSYVRNASLYYREGISWGKRTDWYNAQILPPGFIFSDEGHALFMMDPTFRKSLLAILNSTFIRFLLNKASGGHKTSGYVGKLPVSIPSIEVADVLTVCAETQYARRAMWDTGNEISTAFVTPWLNSAVMRQPEWETITDLLNECLAWEEVERAECQRLQDEVDTTVYDLYNIPIADRTFINRDVGTRPSETVWTQMEGKNDDQKRVEHICRLVSYLVKVSMEEDEDGIIPLVPCGSEQTLIGRVHERLEALFGTERVGAVESEINNLLGKRVTIDTWLAKSYFKYHVGLYKRRPIYWHIASEDGGFGVIIHYHRFTYDRLAKLRSAYLYDFQQRLLSEISGLREDRSPAARERLSNLEANLESARTLDEKLRQIQEGEVPIRVPWKLDAEQPKGWRPDLDDGVKVNIGPFQQAGVLAVKKVV
jgi:hypothetical protein